MIRDGDTGQGVSSHPLNSKPDCLPTPTTAQPCRVQAINTKTRWQHLLGLWDAMRKGSGQGQATSVIADLSSPDCF